MAGRRPHLLQRTMERIVSKPLLATLTVGSSILLLLQLIAGLSQLWPELSYLRYLVPFVPPFFITRTAKRINQRRAEYDFIRDAEPYVFVAFPRKLSVDELLNVSADMISNSASKHFNCPIQDLLAMEALPTRFFENSEERQMIAQQLIDEFQKNQGHGVLQNVHVSLKAQGKETSDLFIVNSVLKEENKKLKWQGTLMKYHPFAQDQNK